MDLTQIRTFVSTYYGTTLKSSVDLKTNACCTAEAPDPHVVAALEHIHPDILSRFYGCGFPIPVGLRGRTVLDLGCGTGRDVYLLSQLVGEAGFVHGIDMTETQLELPRKLRDWHAQRQGFGQSNVAFHHGFIEDLSRFADQSVDVVVSNCVVNLSPLKGQILAEVHRVLRDGGEFYLSDVLCDRRLPVAIAQDPLLHAECLGGASYRHDFLDLARSSGFSDPRIVREARITIGSPELQALAGAARFSSVSLRLLKLGDLEPRCEDYGQVATYLGTLPECPARFVLDDHHVFEAHRPERVCGNTASMLSYTRFAEHFHVTGDRSRHFGEFPCGPTLATPTPDSGSVSCC